MFLQCGYEPDEETGSEYVEYHFGSQVYSVPPNVEDIQVEILENGPVLAIMELYPDFPLYKDGEY